jgi:hypothetical protein
MLKHAFILVSFVFSSGLVLAGSPESKEVDSNGRTIIRGPVYGGTYRNVHIISDSVGVRGSNILLTDSVVDAPICVSTSGMGNTINRNSLNCSLCIEFTGETIMDNQVNDNRCAGRLSNRPDVFGN